MPYPVMDRKVAVWRKAPNGQGLYTDTQVYASIPAAIVPVSDFGALVPFARESTHIVFVPDWLKLRKEDQIRYGSQLPDAQGDQSQWIYTIVGRRDFRMGGPTVIYYARQLD